MIQWYIIADLQLCSSGQRLYGAMLYSQTLLQGRFDQPSLKAKVVKAESQELILFRFPLRNVWRPQMQYQVKIGPP